MLKEFSVKNFMSFRDETFFSMEADCERVSEHPEHVVDICDNKLLKVGSFYGPNGGGKSNVLQALRLSQSVQRRVGMRSSQTRSAPCVFTDSSEIEQTIFFVDDAYEMGYRFSVQPIQEEEYAGITVYEERHDRFPRMQWEILYEEVSYRKKGAKEFTLLFSRDRSGVVQSNILENDMDLRDSLRLGVRMSVLRYLYDTFAESEEELPESLDVIRRLRRQIYAITPLENRKFAREESITKYREQLIVRLRQLDIPVCDICIADKRESMLFGAPDIYFVRECKTASGATEQRGLPLSSESDGTQKLFWLLLALLEQMDKNRIFYCDDMNAYLHPKLSRVVVEMFQESKGQSQLIFNSHDILNMDNVLFRRDEIWFAYRDETFATQLVPLSNIVNYKGEQVRKDAIFHKQYLEGKYGADPFIKRGLGWNG